MAVHKIILYGLQVFLLWYIVDYMMVNAGLRICCYITQNFKKICQATTKATTNQLSNAIPRPQV